MAAPKLKKFPSKQAHLSSISVEERKQLECDKREIKQYIDAIKSKLKSPDMAKKAAIILENYLNESKQEQTETKRKKKA